MAPLGLEKAAAISPQKVVTPPSTKAGGKKPLWQRAQWVGLGPGVCGGFTIRQGSGRGHCGGMVPTQVGPPTSVQVAIKAASVPLTMGTLKSGSLGASGPCVWQSEQLSRPG